MSNVIALNIVFSGTLVEIAEWLENNNSPSGICIMVPQESRKEFEKAGNRRDNLDIDESGALAIFEIRNYYSYGFDINSNHGIQYEIETDEDDTAIYHLVDGFAGEARSAAPAEKVDTIVLPPDVTKLSSDDLFKVVASYDDIHKAAKVELNSRIEAVKGKLE